MQGPGPLAPGARGAAAGCRQPPAAESGCGAPAYAVTAAAGHGAVFWTRPVSTRHAPSPGPTSHRPTVAHTADAVTTKEHTNMHVPPSILQSDPVGRTCTSSSALPRSCGPRPPKKWPPDTQPSSADMPGQSSTCCTKLGMPSGSRMPGVTAGSSLLSSRRSCSTSTKEHTSVELLQCCLGLATFHRRLNKRAHGCKGDYASHAS